jgi:Enolase C-terminal domain-like
VQGVGQGVLGDPWSRKLALRQVSDVWVRHTVGLADRLTDADSGANPEDGLPATLGAAIDAYGLRYFKLKLSGQLASDIDRLEKIEAVIGNIPGLQVTLDGNETFADVDALAALFKALAANAATKRLLAHTLLLEQPLPRQTALTHSLTAAKIPVPVILDESDDHEDVLAQGLALGYGGISSKACKGIYRSLASAAHLQARPGTILSGEDLTCQAGLAVQQDCLLATSLGVTHIERNGHHYVAGFGSASTVETQAFLAAHPGLYHQTAQGVRLQIVDGKLNLASLHQPGFAHSASPVWGDLQSLHL